MSNKELTRNIARLAGASLISIVLGLVGRQIAFKAKAKQLRRKIDRKLDQALEHSMDCSDATAVY